MFDSVNEYRINYLQELDLLVSYINSFNETKDFKQHFTNYKKIIYPSIINNIYVSFEHHVKHLFVHIYRTVEAYDESSIKLKSFSFQSFPGFILEKAFNENNKMVLELSDEVISFTSKNMDVGIICDLFNRIGVEKNFLREKIEKIDSQSYGIPFEEERTVKGKIKFFINHRNQASHSFIEEYYETEVLLEWVKFFKEVYFVIFRSTIRMVLETLSLSKVKIIKTYKDNIICFDNVEDINITKDSILCYENDNECYFYKVKTIESNGSEISQTKGLLEIGITTESIYEYKKISEENEVTIFI